MIDSARAGGSGLPEFPAALFRAKEMFLAVPDIPDGLFLGKVRIANVVLNHDTLNLFRRFRRPAGAGSGLVDPDKEIDHVEDKNEEEQAEQAGEHDENVDDFAGPVNLKADDRPRILPIDSPERGK
jgi:hypothetical protein